MVYGMRGFIEGMALPFTLTWAGVRVIFKVGNWLLKLVKKRKGVYGDATWAKEKQLKKSKHFEPGGFCIGKVGDRPLYADLESSLIMQARPGWGKSSTMGATLARASGEHFIVYDPPGGLHRQFEGDLKAKGYSILVINLDEPMKGVPYDPFSFFVGSPRYPGTGSSRYTLERDAGTLSRLVVWATENGKGHPHFMGVCEGLVSAVALYLHTFDKPNASLGYIAHVLGGMNKPDRMTVLDTVAKCAIPYCQVGSSGYLNAAREEMGSHDTTNARKLRPWSTEGYRELTRPTKTAWAWEDIWYSPQPLAVFVIGGVGDLEGFAPFLTMFFGQCAASLSRTWNREQKPIERGVKIMVDEAALLGRCEPIINAIVELRKAGVSVFLAYQSLSQLRAAFHEKADVILDNCDLIITGGGRNLKDYEMVSKLIGTRTGWAMSKNAAGSNESETGIPHAPPYELMKLSKGEHVVLVGSLAVKCPAPWKIHNGRVVY